MHDITTLNSKKWGRYIYGIFLIPNYKKKNDSPLTFPQQSEISGGGNLKRLGKSLILIGGINGYI